MEVQDTSTLIPGFQHVENFGPDDEYEEVEETCYVTFDISQAEPSLLANTTDFRLIVSRIGSFCVFKADDMTIYRAWIRLIHTCNSLARYSRAAMILY